MTFPFDPDYVLVSKADLAAVLTVYESATPDPANRGSWYHRCVEALGRHADTQEET